MDGDLTAERRRSPESTQDSGWLSVLRGRLLAALASALQVWIAGSGLIATWVAYRAGGMTPELAGRVMAHSESIIDQSVLFVVAILGMISLVASLVSKHRDKRPTRSGRAGPC